MGFVDWDPALETGDREIDQQHRMLFAMLNELHEAALGQRGAAATEEILGRLGKYVVEHFEAERRLMISSAYGPAELQAHLNEHADLTKQTGEMMDRHRNGELVTVLPLALFLQDWLCTHIRQSDRKFVAHLQAQAT